MTRLAKVTRALLRGAGLDPAEVERVVATALAEDIGAGDLTTVAVIPEDQTGVADIVARAGGIVAGLPVVVAVFDAAGDQSLRVDLTAADGDSVSRGDLLASVAGSVRAILSAERTALNLVTRLSGIATHTRAWVEQVAGAGATATDTRKTTPGLRELEKYAVRVGGGANKRRGLFDGILVKDNHAVAAGGIGPAVRRARSAYPDQPVQAEVASLPEAQEAVAAGATYLLCDNMSFELLRSVVSQVDGRAQLEATGGLTIAVAAAYAQTGVDFLSVGALTHSSPALDIALDLRPAPP